MGGNIIMKCMFFSNTRWTLLLVPLQILMSKISHISIHIHNFEHSRVIMNMKLYYRNYKIFLFHRYIKRSQNKAQIPLIIHHNEKKTKKYISDVQQKIILLHKLGK